ncbi:MAG: rhodanese-like domain-containing protein [Deltaproteobacteria bacterium]|nr:MAG: rhodanese-like domain-containing protein [Deltaproteobacteria bacterium]
MSAGARSMLRDTTLVVVGAALVALVTNAVREDGLPLVASAPHAVVVPCPAEVTGPASPIEATDPRLHDAGTVVVDAREAEEFAAWHAPGAEHLYYDLLAESPEYHDAIAALLQTHRSARLVAVYGDDEAGLTTADGQPGDEAGTGFRLAGALSAQGLKNVHYVVGGAAALRAALGAGDPPAGGAP